MFRFFRSFFTAAVPRSQPVPQEETLRPYLPAEQLIEAVRDLSNDDPSALAAARRMLRDGLPPVNIFVGVQEPHDEPRVPDRFSLLAASLSEAGRLVSLDWKEDAAEARASFVDLFEKAGVEGADAVQVLPEADESDVEAAHRLFAAFASSHGLQIVAVDGDSDMYHFALTTPERAARWDVFQIGPNQFIGSRKG